MKNIIALFVILSLVMSPVALNFANASTEVKVTLEDMDIATRRYVMNHMEKVAKKKAKEITTKAQEKIKASETTNKIIDKVTENVTPENFATWGQAIAAGIKAVCSSLKVEVNEFVGTTVGKLTMGLIIYKVIGDDIKAAIGVVISIAIYLLTISAILFSFCKLHLPRKKYEYEADEKGKLKKTRKYEWVCPGSRIFNKNDSKMCSAIAHAGIFLVATIMIIAI